MTTPKTARPRGRPRKPAGKAMDRTIAVRVPDAIWQALEALSRQNERSPSWIVRQAMQHYLIGR